MSEDREFEFSFFENEPQVVIKNEPQKRKKIETSKSSANKKISKPKIQINKEKKKKEVKVKKEEKPKKKIKKVKSKVEKKIENLWEKIRARRLERKGKKISNVNKQIENNVHYEGRYTEPKKRNLLSRIILQHRLENDGFYDIEDEYDYLTQEEVDASKNASKRRDRKLYREVQAYEDAVDDVTVRRGWLAFRAGLAALLLVGAITYTSNTIESLKDITYSPSRIVSIETLNEEQRPEYEEIAENFRNQVKENGGYEFDYLSDEEFLDAYLRIKNREKNMSENQFKGAIRSFKDQEFLDIIVSRAFGEDVFETFSEEKKRDYRQLAFEILPVAQPEIFGESNLYIRNPIVVEVVQAKSDAKEKGYKINLAVNADEEENVRNVGRIIHIENLLDESDYSEASLVNDGQDLLDEIIKEALGDEYDELDEKVIRDYKQIAYELLQDEVKDSYIKNPIDVEKEKVSQEYEIGD